MGISLPSLIWLTLRKVNRFVATTRLKGHDQGQQQAQKATRVVKGQDEDGRFEAVQFVGVEDASAVEGEMGAFEVDFAVANAETFNANFRIIKVDAKRRIDVLWSHYEAPKRFDLVVKAADDHQVPEGDAEDDESAQKRPPLLHPRRIKSEFEDGDGEEEDANGKDETRLRVEVESAVNVDRGCRVEDANGDEAADADESERDDDAQKRLGATLQVFIVFILLDFFGEKRLEKRPTNRRQHHFEGDEAEKGAWNFCHLKAN